MKRKVCLITILVALVALLAGCGETDSSDEIGSLFDYTGSGDNDAVTFSSTDTDEKNPYINPEKKHLGTDVEDVLTQEELNEYRAYFEPADDEYDYRYATDYDDSLDLGLNYTYAKDASAYEKIFGKADVTLEDIRAALDTNNNISRYYKDFIYDYVKGIRELYPDANLSVLHHNLETLVIDEVTRSELDWETLSDGGAAACYIAEENRICVLEGTDFSKDTEEFIILAHELTHASRRILKKYDDGGALRIHYYQDLKFGYYIEEAVITNEMYKLQGMDRRSVYYPLYCNYLRIIQDCTGYDGEDYFNHSVNVLADMMDDYMGDDFYAYEILARIDAQATLKYHPDRADADYYNMQPLYEYLVRMYCRKYLSKDMTKEETEAVFDAFYEEITFSGTSTIIDTYELYEDKFRPAFDACVEELGIQ